jgi:AcrR family transcriptional regulator
MSTTISLVSRAEERAVERSAAVQRSRSRIASQVRSMLDAARRLIAVKGDEFTTQDLVKEAGVALQTFYRYFTGKDELILAVIADGMTEACARWTEAAAGLPDPLARLRFFVVATLERLNDGNSQDAMGTRFIVSAHWRLHRVYPNELAEAEKPFVDLLMAEIDAAAEAGLINPPGDEWNAWFISELLRAVYHFYAYAAKEDDDMDVVKERLWQFCLTALGGDARERPQVRRTPKKARDK